MGPVILKLLRIKTTTTTTTMTIIVHFLFIFRLSFIKKLQVDILNILAFLNGTINTPVRRTTYFAEKTE
jgi:hypothetical protein